MKIMKSQKLLLPAVCLGLIMVSISFFASLSEAEVYYKNQSRGNLINNSLDAWESVEKRHFDILDKRTFDDVERRHYKEVGKERTPNEEKLRDNSYRDGSRFGNGKHRFDAKWGFSNYHYDEPDVMKQKGFMNWVGGEYIYRPGPEDDLYSNYINTYMADINYRWGSDLVYAARGSQEGSVMSPVKDYVLEMRGKIGREYTLDQFDVLVYSGFGYRYMNDMNKPQTSNQGYLSYGREATYYYLPIGVELFTRIDRGLEYTLKGEYDWFLYGQTISHSSDMDWAGGGPSEDTTHNQHKGYGFKGSLEIAKKSESFDFVIEPFVEYWNISGSDVSNSLQLGSYVDIYEPPNYTIESGVKLGVQF